MAREDEIRLIAYNIWEEEGCVDGHDCEHWLRAELLWERQQKEKPVTRTTKTAPKAAKHAAKAARNQREPHGS